MQIDDATKRLLVKQLSFSDLNLNSLEKDRVIRTKTLDLVDSYRKEKPLCRAVPLKKIQTDLLEIKTILSSSSYSKSDLLKNERASYYTFGL